jgi:hypothetical protein
MVNVILFMIAYWFQPPDEIIPVDFSKCVKNQLVTTRYRLLPDSSIVFREYAEQWKSPLAHAGSWSYSGSMIEWKTKDSPSRIYSVDTIMSLVYLIPAGDAGQSAATKEQLRICIRNHPVVQEMSEFTIVSNSEEEKQLVLKRIEYRAALECICGKDVMVETPAEFSNSRDFDNAGPLNDGAKKKGRKKQ